MHGRRPLQLDAPTSFHITKDLKTQIGWLPRRLLLRKLPLAMLLSFSQKLYSPCYVGGIPDLVWMELLHESSVCTLHRGDVMHVAGEGGKAPGRKSMKGLFAEAQYTSNLVCGDLLLACRLASRCLTRSCRRCRGCYWSPNLDPFRRPFWRPVRLRLGSWRWRIRDSSSLCPRHLQLPGICLFLANWRHRPLAWARRSRRRHSCRSSRCCCSHSR
mmetsp:Transcript_23456/g.51867  ORF Transcript_23456/g.51867 Transcript_23456/m.51867 type:complete len:215 (+) Transcript_23456:742-1386(+)